MLPAIHKFDYARFFLILLFGIRRLLNFCEVPLSAWHGPTAVSADGTMVGANGTLKCVAYALYTVVCFFVLKDT